MKHELLDEVWHLRDELSTECGHNVKKLASLLRKTEVNYGDRMARLPIVRKRLEARTRKAAAKLSPLRAK